VNWQAHCAVVIPCLNEAAHIAPLVTSIRKQLPHVICVDDGSTDGTASLAKNAGAMVIRQEHSQGKGAALTTGWRHARELGFQWALNMDGDGQHAPDDIPKFVSAAENTNAPLIIGNRMANAHAMPWLRRFVNRWMSRKLSRAAGRNLPDTQCGFRLMRLDVWSRLPTRTLHFEIESELTLAFARAGHQIEFVPVQVIYHHECSKIRPLRDSVRWFRWWRDVKRPATFVANETPVSLPTSVESKISI
jgi:glycosyltransferase involved in cell wall biosynthesis